MRLVTYQIDLKRVINHRLVMGIGDGVMRVDGREIYVAKDLRVGQDTRGSEPALARRRVPEPFWG